MAKDKLLLKLLKSRRFNSLSKEEKAIELQDYDYQKKSKGGLTNEK